MLRCVRVMESPIINGSGLGLDSIIAKGLRDIWTVVGQKTVGDLCSGFDLTHELLQVATF